MRSEAITQQETRIRIQFYGPEGPAVSQEAVRQHTWAGSNLQQAGSRRSQCRPYDGPDNPLIHQEILPEGLLGSKTGDG